MNGNKPTTKDFISEEQARNYFQDWCNEHGYKVEPEYEEAGGRGYDYRIALHGVTHTVNILNKNSNEVIRSFDLDFEHDHTADEDEINQLEMACVKLIQGKRSSFDDIEWIAVINDNAGEEVGRFESHYFPR